MPNRNITPTRSRFWPVLCLLFFVGVGVVWGGSTRAASRFAEYAATDVDFRTTYTKSAASDHAASAPDAAAAWVFE
jgi:hypothetical protein